MDETNTWRSIPAKPLSWRQPTMLQLLMLMWKNLQTLKVDASHTHASRWTHLTNLESEKKNNVECLMLSICDTMFTLCDSDRTWQLTLVSVVIWERFQTNKQFVRGTLIWTLRRYISDPCTITLMLNLGSVQMMKAKPKQIQWDIWKDSHTG